MNSSTLTLEIIGWLLLCCNVINAQVDGDVRLMGGLSPYEGRVEVYYDGKWSTICDDSWDVRDASVVCRQLGYINAEVAFGNAYFESGKGDILLDEVRCDGDESALLDCPSDGFYIHNCEHTEDSGVRCFHDDSFLGEVRLSGGSSAHDGRVEIYYENEWGTICDSHWDVEDAEVICRQLGYNGVYLYNDQAYFDHGSGPIMSQLECDGDEPYWLQCYFEGWNSTLCEHINDAGVRCSYAEPLPTPYEGSIRLADGSSNNLGRVEIYYQGEWGTICNNNWSYQDASVICRQLGFGGVDTYLKGSSYGKGHGPIMGQLGCSGNEWFWQDCTFIDWDAPYCSHTEDAAVMCSLIGGASVDGNVRLNGAQSEHFGRVEIYHYDEWGTICDNGWSMNESIVTCRQLGHPGALGYETAAYFGSGSGPIILDKVECKGSEHFVTECSHSQWFDHDCSRGDEVGVRCQIPETFYPRLVDGEYWYEGRVEVWDGTRWERFCGSNFYQDEAMAVCQQIGCLDYDVILPGDQFGVGYAPPSDVGFYCGSNDRKLANCYIFAIKGTRYCGSVAVRCKHQNSNNTLSAGIVTGIVLGSICALVCMFGFFALIRQSTKRKRSRTPASLVAYAISGKPISSNLYKDEHVDPPRYSDTMSKTDHYFQRTGVIPTDDVIKSDPQQVSTSPLYNR